MCKYCVVFFSQYKYLHSDMRCVSRNKGEAFKPKNTEPTVKHCGDSIMHWACATALLYIKDEILKKELFSLFNN